MYKLSEDIKSKANGKRIAVIGVGAFCTLNMRFLIELGLDIAFFVDADYQNRKYFEFQTGFQVMPYSSLNRKEHFPFVFQHNYEVINSIVAELCDHGFNENDYLILPDIANRDLIWKNMMIGKGASSFDVMMDWNLHVKSIGRYSSINHTAQIVFDHNTTHITTVNMEYSPVPARERLVIGHDVWIGANAVINASKVKTIGNGAIIGSGAVVINDVPPYSVVVGVPAQVRKFRFSNEQIAILERVCWWDWDEAKKKDNGDLFTNTENFFAKFRD